MADEDSVEKPSDAAPDDAKDPPVQPVQEEEVEGSKERRADSIQVDTIDGPEESTTVFSSGKSSGGCGGCPVLTVIILGILVGNAFGLLLIYQKFYAGKGSLVKPAQIKATLTPSLAPTANQRRRSISEEIAQKIDLPKMTSSHLRADDERRNPVRGMPKKADEKTHRMPFLVTKRKELEAVEDIRRLPVKMDKKTSRKISKFQFRKENALP